MIDPTLLQYCQKIVVFREGGKELLLVRRKGEADYDQTYSFIGGKLETTDGGLTEGIKREKTEEIGFGARLRICPHISYNVYFVKNSGHHMVLPHYYAEFEGGEIVLSDEYDDYKWVKLSEIDSFEPKIANIPELCRRALQIKASLRPEDFVLI